MWTGMLRSQASLPGPTGIWGCYSAIFWPCSRPSVWLVARWVSASSWISPHSCNFCSRACAFQNFFLHTPLPGFCLGCVVVFESCISQGSPEKWSPIDLLLGIKSCSFAGQVPGPVVCTLEAQESWRSGMMAWEPESRPYGLWSVSQGLWARGTDGVNHSPRQKKIHASV